MDNAPSYDVIREYSEDFDTDEISVSPYWVIAVCPLALPLSFSRASMDSVSKMAGDGAQVRSPGVFVITSDCTQMQISGTKESHVKNLSASLKQGDINYLVDILPGDWVGAWIVNSEDKGRQLVQDILAGNPVNDFESGLKFIGRVWSIRKTVQMNRGTGLKTSNYNLSAYAFKELDTSVFYDPMLAEYQKDESWLAKIGFDITSLFTKSSGGIINDNVHILIPAFVEILLGRGLPADINPTGDGALQAVYGPVEDPNANPKEASFAYLVPKPVGNWLGKTASGPSKQGGILAYCDILTLLFGVQTYNNTDNTDTSLFLPSIATNSTYTTAQHRYTGTPLIGASLSLQPDFTNKPLWSILQQFLNPVVNEMYTTMRVAEDGTIQPTLVVRQIPFTTNSYILKAQQDYEDQQSSVGPRLAPIVTPRYTAFLSVPRWKISPTMVTSVDIGRSDATRVNFVHVYGQNDYTGGIEMIDQLVANPPIRDSLDIQRSGMHPFQTTIACDTVNQEGDVPKIWMELIADRLMGSQFTLNGSIDCVGISAPICEGDNLEWDDVIYHIESYIHSCGISPDGGKFFNTSVTLTNGLRGDYASRPDTGEDLPNGSATDRATANDDAVNYPGVEQGDNTYYDPGITTEGDDNRKSLEESDGSRPDSGSLDPGVA